MKKNRLLMMLLMAVVTGGLAGWLALGQLRKQAIAAPALSARVERVQLAVAARDLPLGAMLASEDVRLVDWPGDVLPAGYAGTAAELVGRGVIAPVRANEPLLATKLADREAGAGMPILIPDGMRAVSVRVDEVSQVAGYVTPGTRVDVLVTLSPGENAPIVTKVILQNIQVLAAGQTIERDAEEKPQAVSVITLLVSPDDAEKLTLGAAEGRVQLALRGALDAAEVRTAGARLSTLVEGMLPPRAAPRAVPLPATPQHRGTVVETFRGGVRTLNTF
jgi:pilus assembly protein CpaB